MRCSYAYENSDFKDTDDIPVRLFWDGNQARIDDHLHEVRGHLLHALKVLFHLGISRDEWTFTHILFSVSVTALARFFTTTVMKRLGFLLIVV
jgi:hypothetical protein